jgi:eukaryotic-like serine/threonine-protein kinase
VKDENNPFITHPSSLILHPSSFPMTPERWAKIEELFNAALETPVAERAAYLDSVCGDDAELRGMIERLLRSDAEAGDFIETPPQVSQATRLFNNAITLIDQPVSSYPKTTEMIGRQIGAYKIERELGRGGMGEVYLAWRADNEFRKQVAIKLVRRGVDSENVLRRFRRERQILASFDHPNIARLLDGGTTEDGVPYLVMEYIEGQPLTRFCDEHQLALAERVKLFVQVCNAVEYAHQQQVIHRDIKPGNILVTREEMAKLLDFGIARILKSTPWLDTGEHTVTGMQMMTPEYASPEQMRGEAVTAASDQYSLGVLLYELLTGRRPYQLRHKLLHEVARLIIEEPPTRPSNAIQQTEEVYSPTFGQTVTLTPELVSRQRATSPETLTATLASGLDAIVLKALSKTTVQRYATVAELITDLQHWLQGLPVAAPIVPPGAERSVSPTVSGIHRRHSIAILPLKPLQYEPGATQSFLGVGLADALITRLSNLRSLIVRPTGSVLKYANPESDAVSAGCELNVTHVLDGRFWQSENRLRVTVQLIEVASAAPQWAAQFDESSTDLLALQDMLAEQVAHEIARNLSGEERAQIAKRGTDSPEAYEAYLRGRYYWHTYTEEGLARAITCFYEAIAIDPQFAAAYSGVADYFNFMGITAVLPPEECFQAAKQAAQRAIELDPSLAEAHVSLALAIRSYDWDYAMSQRLMQRAIELNDNYAQAHEWLAHFYSSQGQHTDAINEMRRALRIDPQSPALHTMMVFILHNARQHREAYRYNKRAFELEPNYYLAFQAQAWLYPRVGHPDEALAAARKAVELTNHAPLSLWALAHVLAVSGKRSEAHTVLDELRAIARQRYVPHYFFVRIHTALGEYDAAFDCLRLSCERRESWALEMQVDPQLDALRSDPRFGELLARLHPYQSNAEGIETIAEEDLLLLRARASLPATPTIATSLPEEIAAETAGKETPVWFKWLIPTAALLLLGGIAYVYFRPQPSPTIKIVKLHKPTNTIAVLPLQSDAADESLGAGLADGVIRQLSQIKQLTVRPLSALQRATQGGQTPEQIAREQQVEYVVTGTLHRANDVTYVDAQMYSASANRQLWSAKLEMPTAEIARLQAVLTERVLGELKFEVTGSELLQLNKRYTINSEAYQLYLVGRSHFAKRSVPALREAINQFNRALQKDDKFALAYAGLADSYALLNWYGALPPREGSDRARENAQRALALDDQLAEPHASLAYVLFWYDRDHAGAEREMRRAIELNPSYSTAHHWLALMLAALGRFDEAKAQIQTAEQLDPRSAIVKTAAAVVWYYARQYDEALDWTRRALDLDSSLVAAHRVQRWIYQAQGNYGVALAAYQRERQFSNATTEWPGILAQVQASGQRQAEAQATLQRALTPAELQRAGDYITYEIALDYALLGLRDQAFAWLEKADAVRTNRFNFIAVDPLLDGLRDDARFAALLRKAGLDLKK